MPSQTQHLGFFTPLTPFFAVRFYASIALRQPKFNVVMVPLTERNKGTNLDKTINLVWTHTDCLMPSQTHFGANCAGAAMVNVGLICAWKNHRSSHLHIKEDLSYVCVKLFGSIKFS
jgi:hypothetical protein